MRRLSLQWRMTLMTSLLIGATCVCMELLLCGSGVRYMSRIGSYAGGDQELLGAISQAQQAFCMTNWYIAAALTLLSGTLAYFVSGRALRPLRGFLSRFERVEPGNLAEMKFGEDVPPEFRSLGRSFNSMLERLERAFETQRQFTGNAAHELRTPLALMQAQLELFSAEHPDVLPETAEFLKLLREQTERLSQLSKTLLEMSSLQSAARTDRIQLGPMIEEIFTDLAPLAERVGVTLEREGDAAMTGSDSLIYRLLFNLTENAIKYNRRGGSVLVSVSAEQPELEIRVSDTGHGIPESCRSSVFHPLFPGGPVPQPGARRRRPGPVAGLGDRRPPRRWGVGGTELRRRDDHPGASARPPARRRIIKQKAPDFRQVLFGAAARIRTGETTLRILRMRRGPGPRDRTRLRRRMRSPVLSITKSTRLSSGALWSCCPDSDRGNHPAHTAYAQGTRTSRSHAPAAQDEVPGPEHNKKHPTFVRCSLELLPGFGPGTSSLPRMRSTC